VAAARGRTHLRYVITTSTGKRAAARARGPVPIEIHSPDFTMPHDLAAYLRAKLGVRLTKFENRLLDVVVRVKDENGPKGGIGLSCRMEAVLAGLEPVNVLEHDDDLRAAIDRSIDRLALAVQRHVDRARGLPRNRGRKLVRHIKLTGTS
jgi:putative sigma-54 modulation protein